jgi:GTP cyclohydrolase I
MENIELPLPWQGSLINAHVDAYVSLDARETKGIHMSRLFLIVQRSLPRTDIFDPNAVQKVLGEFLASHHGLSSSAHLTIRGQLPLERKALKSANRGWRFYPFTLRYEGGKQQTVTLDLEIVYSSTCPCSAALARQLIQQQFDRDFAGGATLTGEQIREWLGRETSIMATPHGQRSAARLHLSFAAAPIDVVRYIDATENALGTPVQTAVKREDEQEFARLNGSNLMFAEDAARRMQSCLVQFPELVDFRVEAHHFESLHAHDAVAYATKEDA